MVRSKKESSIASVAGGSLHPLALGSVRSVRIVRIVRRLTDSSPDLKDISSIGVGGLADGSSFNRMINGMLGLVPLR